MHLSEIVTCPTNETEANFTNVSLWEPAVHEVFGRERIRYKFFPPGVLVNGDLTDDRIYLVETEAGWRISGLIDFADAAIGPPELDLDDIRFWTFAPHLRPMRAFLGSYYDRPVKKSDLKRSFLIGLCVPNTDYGLRANVSPELLKRIQKLDDLKEVLWPRALFCSNGPVTV